MSFQERAILVGLVVSVGFFWAYTSWVALPLRDGGFVGTDGPMAVARLTLWIIGGSVVATIAATILAEILYAIVTNTPNPRQLVDERDRQIEHFGDRVGGYLSGMVFVAALIALALGTAPVWAIVIITYGFFFGSLLSTILRLVQHRRGY